MKKRLGQKYRSYSSICNVLTDHTVAVKSTLHLEEKAQAFKFLVQDLVNTKVPERFETKGVTDDKNNLYAEIVANVTIEMNALMAYAHINKDLELAGRMPTTPSDLTKGDSLSQLERFERVHAEAKALAVKLPDYGADASLLAEVGAQLLELRTKITAPREAIDNRKLVRAEQEGTFQKADLFLAEFLDHLVNTRAKLFPTFVSAYFQARKLHDNTGASRRPAPEGLGENLAREMKSISVPLSSNEEVIDLQKMMAVNGVH